LDTFLSKAHSPNVHSARAVGAILTGKKIICSGILSFPPSHQWQVVGSGHEETTFPPTLTTSHLPTLTTAPASWVSSYTGWNF
jgi:hypothetical protein